MNRYYSGAYKPDVTDLFGSNLIVVITLVVVVVVVVVVVAAAAAANVCVVTLA